MPYICYICSYRTLRMTRMFYNFDSQLPKSLRSKTIITSYYVLYYVNNFRSVKSISHRTLLSWRWPEARVLFRFLINVKFELYNESCIFTEKGDVRSLAEFQAANVNGHRCTNGLGSGRRSRGWQRLREREWTLHPHEIRAVSVGGVSCSIAAHRRH